MSKPLIIFNAAARGEKAARALRFLAAKAAAAFTLVQTTGPGDARRLAAEAVARGCSLVVAAGGDGTINEVVNGIGVAGVTLGVVPLGTANVFARELGIPTKPEPAWAVIESGRVRAIDLGRAEAGGASRFFVQLAGVGVDAAAVRRVSRRLKRRIGPLSYVWAGLKTVAGPLPELEVSLNGGNGCGSRGAAVLVGNGRLYGGPFVVFPRARVDDGLLDVCVFGRGGCADLLRYAQGVMRGVHTGFGDVRYFQAEEFLCASRGPVTPFELDGEDAGDAPVRFSVLPGALRVLVPRNAGGTGHA